MKNIAFRCFAKDFREQNDHSNGQGETLVVDPNKVWNRRTIYLNKKLGINTKKSKKD